jgi:hypothetical protein
MARAKKIDNSCRHKLVIGQIIFGTSQQGRHKEPYWPRYVVIEQTKRSWVVCREGYAYDWNKVLIPKCNPLPDIFRLTSEECDAMLAATFRTHRFNRFIGHSNFFGGPPNIDQMEAIAKIMGWDLSSPSE